MNRPRRLLISAHRGSSADAPENTLCAIDRAIDDGADFAEIDVQETGDGHLALLHDATLARTVGVRKGVWEVTLAEVRPLEAGRWFSPAFAGEPIPTLAQVLDLARGRIGLNVELKYDGHDQRLAERTVAVIRAAGSTPPCMVTSSSLEGLRQVRALAPEIPIGRIVTARSDAETAADLPLDRISLHAPLATAQRLRANRAAGLATHVWSVDDPDAMARMIRLGVDGIITNRPALLRRLVAHPGQ